MGEETIVSSGIADDDPREGTSRGPKKSKRWRRVDGDTTISSGFAEDDPGEGTAHGTASSAEPTEVRSQEDEGQLVSTVDAS